MTKQRLGKGLGALFPDDDDLALMETGARDKGVMELPLDKISTNPGQPRKDFDEAKLQEMAETMLNFGVIQPVIVQSRGDAYVLVAGERRWRAAALAGLKTIPALVRDYPSEQITVVALIENLQRQDLNPVEEAGAFQLLMREHGLTQEEIAARVGKSRSAIANALRLLSLDPVVQAHIVNGALSTGQARPLLALAEGELQQKLAAEIVSRQLSVREVEKMIRSLRERKKVSEKVEEKVSDLSKLLLDEQEEKLRRNFGTKVLIRADGGEGRIELYFYGEDDLERLVNALLAQHGGR